MALPRIHAFEINDHPAAPEALKETIIEALSRTLDWGKMLDGLVPELERFWTEAGVTELLDLGAGAGGPARVVSRILRRRAVPADIKIILTDLQPREEAWRELKAEFPDYIDYIARPIDATDVPMGLTMGRGRLAINVFHHFPPEIAKEVLADAVRAGEPIFISEGFERNPLQFANFALYGLPSLFLNPVLTANRSWKKTLLTYGAPGLVLGASIWDGLVSSMRVYTEEELRAMVADLPGDYHWEYGNFSYAPAGKGYYFHGIPK